MIEVKCNCGRNRKHLQKVLENKAEVVRRTLTAACPYCANDIRRNTHTGKTLHDRPTM